MSDLHYWYTNLGSSNLISDLPAQAIPKSKKDLRWKKATMNALERIGITQFNENLRLVDYYRMSQGKVSYTEISALMPQLKHVEEYLDELQIPNTIKHYDLLGIIIRYLQTVMMENRDKFHPTAVDEVTSNERQNKIVELMRSYVQEEWNKQLQIKLIEMGIDVNRQDFESEEEQQAFLQEVEQQKNALTPDEIKNFMEKEWKPIALEWAEHTLEADSVNFGENDYSQDEIDRDLIEDYLHTGRCFQEFYVGHDYYSSRKWSPIQTFFSQTIDSKYPQYGEYIGRVHFYTPSDFINLYGSKFSQNKVVKILNQNKVYETGAEGDPSFATALKAGFQETHFTPHANYYDYNFLLNLQDHLGVPLGSTTIFKEDGTSQTTDDFLPRRMSHLSGNVIRYARFLREDLNLRTDMIMVTEAYWRSYKQIGLLRYISPEGVIAVEMITEDIFNDFLEEMGIKSIKNMSLDEWEKSGEVNTVVWQYVPEIWKGKKALTSNTLLQEDLFFDIEPLEYQLKSNSNLYNLLLPVAGIVDQNPSDRIINFQNLYNIVMNQQYNLIEKEIGVFFLFDINFLPSDIKSYGDTETTLYKVQNIIRNVGLLGTDASAKNLQGAPVMNGFSVQDLSLTNMISAKAQQAEFFKNKAFEQFGINPQILGEPVKYQTAEGVQQMSESTRTQTDYLYEAFRNFKQRALEMHLSVAQYAQGEGIDIRVEYTKSDQSQVFLKFTDPNFPLRRFGVVATSNSKKRKELELMKQYMLNQNTMGSDEYTLAQIVSSDSMMHLINIAKMERMRRDLMLQQQQQQQQAILQQEADLEEKKALNTWMLNEKSKEQDRLNRIEVARISATGRATDNNATKFALDYIQKTADRSLRQQQMENDLDIKMKELDSKIESEKDAYKQSEEQLRLKAEELELKKEKLANDKYIAEINKN